MKDWISVEKRFPKDNQKVLATDGKDCEVLIRVTAYDTFNPKYYHKCWCLNRPVGIYDYNIKLENITHWMPLPNLPKKEK